MTHEDDAIERFASSLTATLTWVTVLPPADRDRFVVECVEMLHSCASIGRYFAFAELIEDWRSTAAVHMDSRLARRLSKPVDEPLDKPV